MIFDIFNAIVYILIAVTIIIFDVKISIGDYDDEMKKVQKERWNRK